MNITIVSRQASESLTEQTAFYDVRYALDRIDPEFLASWEQARSGVGQGDSVLVLPEPNPYVPERLEARELAYVSEKPLQMKGQDALSPWYQADQEFGLPKASFYFSVMSPIANNTVRNSVMLDIMMRVVNDQLNKSVYPAYLAGLNYSLYRHPHGFSARINGFEDKQSELMKVLVSAIASPDYDSEKLALIKADLARRWKNSDKESPSSQTAREVYRLVMRPSWTEEEKLAVIDDITIQDLITYFDQFFSRVKVNVLSHGDVSFENTVERASILNELLTESEFLIETERSTPRKLTEGADYVRTLDIDHGDSAIVVYYQGLDKGLEERARMALLGQLVETPFYSQLRTTHRVGYLVYGGSLPILELPGLFFSVQSPSHSISDIQDLMETFFKDFDQQLDGMASDAFEQAKDGLLSKILVRDKNLAKRSGRYWREIDLGKTDFDRL